MVDVRTEEEQIEALKGWWKRNGTAVLLGIGLALALIFGWQAWEQHQAEQRAQASARFQELFAALNTADVADQERQGASVTYLAEQLRTDHEDSAYAVLGSLLEARYLVEQEKAAEAVQSLQWALANASERPLPLVIRERLARAQFIAGEGDAALATLQAVGDVGVFLSVYKELEGDILKAEGDIEAAREAYKVASETAVVGENNPVLQLKMADLAIAGDQ